LALERSRQALTQDDKFFRRMLFFFELRVPGNASVTPTPQSYRYPLVIPPTSYSLSEPFVVEQTQTLDGGLYVEERGIVAREVRITGNTGVAPRRNPGQSTFDIILPPERKSYSRKLPQRARALLAALSGQRHFQFLQDSVFRTYADLKRDPATSGGTSLYFYVPKDDERWRAFPLSFDLTRDGASPFLYTYDIRLLVTEPDGPPISEDKRVLDVVKNPFRMLKFGVQTVQSAILDLANIQGQLDNLITGGTSLIGDAAGIANAASAFLDGTDRLVKTPLQGVTRTKDAIEAGMGTLAQAQLLGSGPSVPGSLLNTLRKVQDGLLVLASYPEVYQTPVGAAVEAFNARQSLATSQTPDALEGARSATPPRTLREWRELGTSLLPGDYRRAREDLGLGSTVPRFSSAVERVVEQGDTLTTIAARFLGDARQWKILAVFNGLQPPFITEQRLPGTLRVGDKILVPSYGKASQRETSLATMGVAVDAPAEEHFLGVDFALSPVPGPGDLVDFVVDVENGSVDFKRVRGRENLTQGLTTRVMTEQGTVALYPTLGLRRVVGLGVTAIDVEQAQFSVIEAVSADPRVAAVSGLDFSNTAEAPDVITVDMDVSIRGIAKSERIQVTS